MKKTRTPKASSLITKSKSYAMSPGSKYITVSTWDGKGKNGYSNKYIPNTQVNRDKISSLLGKPEKYGKKLIWM